MNIFYIVQTKRVGDNEDWIWIEYTLSLHSDEAKHKFMSHADLGKPWGELKRLGKVRLVKVRLSILRNSSPTWEIPPSGKRPKPE